MEEPYTHPHVQKAIRMIWLRTAWIIITLVPLLGWNDPQHSFIDPIKRMLLPAIILGGIVAYTQRTMRQIPAITAGEPLIDRVILQVRAYARTLLGIAGMALLPSLAPPAYPTLALLISGGLGLGVIGLFGRYLHWSAQLYQQLAPHQLLYYLMRDRSRLMLTTIFPLMVIGFALVLIRLDMPQASLTGSSPWPLVMLATILIFLMGWGKLYLDRWQRRLYRKEAWQ